MRHRQNALLALALPLALAACGDPLRNVDRLSDVDLRPDTLAAAAVPPPEEQADAPGLLSRIWNGTLTQGPSVGTDAAVDAAVIEALGDVAVGGPDLELASAAEAAPMTGTDVIEGDTEMARASAPEEAPPRRRGIFGLLNAAGAEPPPLDGPDAQQIAPGTTLAYGQIATVCGLGRRELGRRVGEASGYAVYDTDTGSTALRTHYITGFDDGCARQIRAALVLFGDVGTHEVIRYSAGTSDLAYSDTDNAYEEIKARVCRVSARQPCGDQLERLARRTTFLTVYSNFGANPEWADILLSDGQVVAMDFKG